MKLLQAALTRPIVMASLRVSLVVGTVLNLINLGPTIYAGQDIAWLRLLLNYAVPYCVASYSGAAVAVRHGGGP
jgi:hypothetical protein